MSEDVDPIEMETLTQDVELLEERLDLPERVILGPVGPPTAELVVADDRVPERRERVEPRHPLAR